MLTCLHVSFILPCLFRKTGIWGVFFLAGLDIRGTDLPLSLPSLPWIWLILTAAIAAGAKKIGNGKEKGLLTLTSKRDDEEAELSKICHCTAMNRIFSLLRFHRSNYGAFFQRLWLSKKTKKVRARSREMCACDDWQEFTQSCCKLLLYAPSTPLRHLPKWFVQVICGCCVNLTAASSFLPQGH